MDGNAYRFTSNDYVVIKKLSREWIRRHPRHPESVWNQLVAATLLGDDEHVHTITEVLADRQFPFIVMLCLGVDIYDTFAHH